MLFVLISVLLLVFLVDNYSYYGLWGWIALEIVVLGRRIYMARHVIKQQYDLVKAYYFYRKQ